MKDALLIIRGQLKMGHTLSFAEAMLLQQAIDIAVEHAGNSPVIPDSYVLMPQQIFLDADDIEAICSQCGDGHKNGYGEYTDGLLWVGDIQGSNGEIIHGLHVSSADYSEDGGITIAEFPAVP